MYLGEESTSCGKCASLEKRLAAMKVRLEASERCVAALEAQNRDVFDRCRTRSIPQSLAKSHSLRFNARNEPEGSLP